MYISDFTADNLGSADQYTVQTPCQKIVVKEKDRTAATLATFNVYMPPGSPSYSQHLGGEVFTYMRKAPLQIGDQPFAIETVNVGTAVFSVMESVSDV